MNAEQVIAPIGKRKQIISLVILAALFFVFGFLTWINAILIPYFKVACRLTHLQSYFVTFAFYIAYFFLSVPSSLLLARFGFKSSIKFGLWTMAVGAFLFIPAAQNQAYSIFLLGLFTIGTGLAVLQSAVNPYITILGPMETAARRISIMGICNKFAGLISPLVFAHLVLQSTDAAFFTSPDQSTDEALRELVLRIIPPYTVIGSVLLLLGFLIHISPLPEIKTEGDSQSNPGKVLQYPYLVLGAFAIFFHVGTQVIAIDTVIGYASTMNIPILEAKQFPSYTLLATIVGYLVGITLIPKYASQLNVLRVCVTLGVILSLLVIFTHGQVVLLGHHTDISIWFLMSLGFCNSMIWAGIWPLALNGLGPYTRIGAAILIMGLSGSAILPLGHGFLADHDEFRTGYWVLVPSYLYLVFYAFYGYGIKQWRTASTLTTNANETAG